MKWKSNKDLNLFLTDVPIQNSQIFEKRTSSKENKGNDQINKLDLIKHWVYMQSKAALKAIGSVQKLRRTSKKKLKPSNSFDGRKQSINISVSSPIKQNIAKSPEWRESVMKKDKN